jgi:hypothetical protein
MSWNAQTRPLHLTFYLAAVLSVIQSAKAAERSVAEEAVSSAARDGKYAFILFYRQNDATTQSMYQTLRTELAQRTNATCVAVRITDPAEAGLVEKYDATRTPMPAAMAVAPNEAITGVFVQNVTPQHVEAAIVTPGQARCMRALQDQKLVLLCIQPAADTPVPDGVTQFQSDDLFRERTAVITIPAADPAEARFLAQLGVAASTSSTVTAFMAPPGVLLGKYDANVTLDTLARRLAAAGKCCDDPNCRHHRSNAQPARQR